MRAFPVVFAIGPLGTGKTYIPARVAMQSLARPNGCEKIIISRPTAAPARHRMGFLPGNPNAKMKPWLIPVMDGFRAEASQAAIDKLFQAGKIEVVPFEHMRGRTFHDSFVILDEAQNATFDDLEMFLTRTGENSTVAICGDHWQSDIGSESGLLNAYEMIGKYGLNAGAVCFSYDDVVRSPAAKEWGKAFHAEKTGHKRLAA